MSRSRARRGFTLIEMSIVLVVMAICAALVIPTYSDLGQNPPPVTGDALIALLRDSRKWAIENNQTVALRLDPKSNYYRVDTTGIAGTGVLVDGTLQLGTYESLESEQDRLNFVFRPSGAGIGDTVSVRGNSANVVLSIDTWSGVVTLCDRSASIGGYCTYAR